MFELLIIINNHPSRNDCCGEGACDRADQFDDVYPGIYVIDWENRPFWAETICRI